MSHQDHDHAEIRNPGPFRVPGALQGVFVLFVLIGIAAFVAGLSVDAKRAWYSYLLNHFYFMSLGLGGLFLASLHWATGAFWTAPVRRVMESFTAYIPVAIVTFAILYLGIHHLYIWSDPAHVHGDHVLEVKAKWLTGWFFILRNVVFLGIMVFFGSKIVGNSIAQDTRKGDLELTRRNIKLAPAFLIVFGVLYTMSSFDSLMSLDPHWYSTMFGVYCFAGLFYAALALTAVVTVYLKRMGALEGIVNENHLHDIGKFMFAFTIFYAYIGFAQFMLIWYANIPEETRYFIHRAQGAWLYVSIFLLAGKFAVPFFLLLPRDAKRKEKVLVPVAVFMLIAHWIDVYWMSQPEYAASGPVFGWIEIGVTLGFLGLFGLAVARFLGRYNVVAIGDPALERSVFHHHQ